MIDFNNLKFVIYDFDDTLCIHSTHNYSDKDNKVYNEDVIKKGKDTWKDCSINKQMGIFMLLCQEEGLSQGLMSATKSVKHADAKCDWVESNYGIRLENFSVGDASYKIEMLIAIADAYNLCRSSILLVDDCWKNLESASNAGFQACSPMEIVNFVSIESE